MDSRDAGSSKKIDVGRKAELWLIHFEHFQPHEPIPIFIAAQDMLVCLEQQIISLGDIHSSKADNSISLKTKKTQLTFALRS